jgi:hypothetical protein
MTTLPPPVIVVNMNMKDSISGTTRFTYFGSFNFCLGLPKNLSALVTSLILNNVN